MSEGKWGVVAPAISGLVVPVAVDPSGVTGPTRGQAQGKGWRRSSPGLYVPSETVVCVEQRILEQGVRLNTGALTGWAALRLQGGGYFDGLGRDGVTELPVPVAAGNDRLRSSADVTVQRSCVEEHDVVMVQGVRCLRPHRALFDEMRRTGDLREAVVAADMAAAARLVTIAVMTAYAKTRVGERGLWLVREALGLAVDSSWSPMESRLRLIWVLDAGWDARCATAACWMRPGGSSAIQT